MNRFKEMRLAKGFKTQKELADILFVNQTAVSQWERGVTTPSSQMLPKLSELYGVSINYLLGQTDNPMLTGEEKEPTPEEGGGLNDEQMEIVSLYKSAPPVLRAAALAVLRSAEWQGKAPGGASEGE